MAAHVTKHEVTQRLWFKAEVGRRLEALGATKREEKCYPYLLHTRIGPVEIAPEDCWVACVWSDLDRAKEDLLHDWRFNRHCGKWNLHYADVMFKSRQMAQAAVDDFFCELSVFLPAAASGE
jgi:hypothetical protein